MPLWVSARPGCRPVSRGDESQALRNAIEARGGRSLRVEEGSRYQEDMSGST